MARFHDKKDGMEKLYQKLSDKLTLFKMKQENMKGEKCTRCKWREIKGDFSRYCPKCTKEVGNKGI